jgi:putative ABC transport system permease protein
VIGVIEDFHFKDLHETIDPLVMYLEPQYEGTFMAMSLEAGNVVQSVAEVQGVWKQYLPQHEFEYQFLDESFNSLFEQEKRLSTLFTIFSGLAILISCLGLFGLASFTMEQSRKSVAIRKVMGASVSNILFMMSKDFLKLVFLGMIVASPVAWYAMDKWLQGFAYSVGFGWLVFIYAAVVALLVAFITVSYHSLKAATTNPVNSLKDN